MKVFAATMVILTVMVAIICLNRFYILNVANNLEKHIDDIDEGAQKSEVIDKAEKYWDSVRSFVSLTANYSTVEEIDRRFIGLKAFYRNGREADFEYELELFRDTLNKIRRPERLMK